MGLSSETQEQLQNEAKRLAAVFQRSSSNVEGRNGYLSLRSHQLRGLDLPRKRQCFTAIHNFFLTRPDGTTAAERFFGQKPRSMFAAILESVELAPAPLNPPRKHKVADPTIEAKKRITIFQIVWSGAGVKPPQVRYRKRRAESNR